MKNAVRLIRLTLLKGDELLVNVEAISWVKKCTDACCPPWTDKPYSEHTAVGFVGIVGVNCVRETLDVVLKKMQAEVEEVGEVEEVDSREIRYYRKLISVMGRNRYEVYRVEPMNYVGDVMIHTWDDGDRWNKYGSERMIVVPKDWEEISQVEAEQRVCKICNKAIEGHTSLCDSCAQEYRTLEDKKE